MAVSTVIYILACVCFDKHALRFGVGMAVALGRFLDPRALGPSTRIPVASQYVATTNAAISCAPYTAGARPPRACTQSREVGQDPRGRRLGLRAQIRARA